METISLISSIILILPAIFLLYSLIQSYAEKENRAAIRLLFVFFLYSVVLLSGFILMEYKSGQLILILSGAVLILSALVVFFPWPEKKWKWERGTPDRIDERNIMFSRAELEPGSKRFDEYYKLFPEHKHPDDNFRKQAGLLSNEGLFYNPWLFAAADATFFTVEALHPKTDGAVANKKMEFGKRAMTTYIKNWLREMGSHSIGVTELKPHHLYHTGGRKHNYGEKVVNNHKYAIVLTVEMDFERVKSSPRSPIILESSAQYLRSGNLAVQLAAFIRNLGYSARAHIDGKYQLRCPEVAKDAGLGELGRMNLLMTPKLGPRVRIAAVTTDLPLDTDIYPGDSSMLKFCRICKKCAETCPAQAISYDDPREVGGARQWNINQESCFTYWCKTGTDCGRCISVCPYSHPDNLLHNVVRLFIKISPVFRKIAVKLDDWLYGRKPPERELPFWMKSE